MAENFHNGLQLVPLSPSAVNQYISRTAACAPAHPWRALFQPRAPPAAQSIHAPESQLPPVCYANYAALRSPISSTVYRMTFRPRGGMTCSRSQARQPAESISDSSIQVHETIRLKDVEAFRTMTAIKAMHNVGEKESRV
ncbi:hypothetical protein PFISCL1PPCAC_16797, partial [Pristionchus fissidentatus]